MERIPSKKTKYLTTWTNEIEIQNTILQWMVGTHRVPQTRSFVTQGSGSLIAKHLAISKLDSLGSKLSSKNMLSGLTWQCMIRIGACLWRYTSTRATASSILYRLFQSNRVHVGSTNTNHKAIVKVARYIM